MAAKRSAQPDVMNFLQGGSQTGHRRGGLPPGATVVGGGGSGGAGADDSGSAGTEATAGWVAAPGIEDYARFRRQQPATLTAREAEQIRLLSQDLPALWHAPTTTAADRQEIIRLLVERVVGGLPGAVPVLGRHAGARASAEVVSGAAQLVGPAAAR